MEEVKDKEGRTKMCGQYNSEPFSEHVNGGVLQLMDAWDFKTLPQVPPNKYWNLQNVLQSFPFRSQ